MRPKQVEGGGLDSRCRFLIFFRERATSLYITGQSDRRNSSEQEGKLFYAARPTRGLRF